MLVAPHMSVVFLQFWAGFTAMVRCTRSLRTGTGGVVLRIVVRGGINCITMVVAYIPAPTAAAMGSTCGALVRKRMYQT